MSLCLGFEKIVVHIRAVTISVANHIDWNEVIWTVLPVRSSSYGPWPLGRSRWVETFPILAHYSTSTVMFRGTFCS